MSTFPPIAYDERITRLISSVGRSALQNEIIGNLVTEFAQSPDAVEDLAITELAQELQKTSSGKLGPFINEWLGKRISAELAPSLTLSKLRVHLRDSFGLKG